MIDPEKLKGERMIDALKALVESRTLINLRIVGREYDRLTMITEVRTPRRKAAAFCIDPPRGFRDAVVGKPDTRLRFKFTGDDRLEHHFETEGVETAPEGVWIPCPKAINRIQRRRYFRVEVPLGTQIQFELERALQILDVLNISAGGALVIFARQRKDDGREVVLKTGRRLVKLELVLPDEGEMVRIPIRQAEVKRFEKDPNTGRYRYGIEFQRLGRLVEQELTRHIYRLQRLILQKR
jgi:c-di-GMP-binding flagellar brake protein YcgR